MSLEPSEALGALISSRMKVLQVDPVRPQGFANSAGRNVDVT